MKDQFETVLRLQNLCFVLEMKKLGISDTGYGLCLDIAGEKVVQVETIIHNGDKFAEWFLSKFFLRKALNILMDDIDNLEHRYLLYNESIK